MGLINSYLSKPITEKESSDESNSKLNCGASSMQGWRLTQEDAHNCLLNFDRDTSFFAVYDGHGGDEVAKYCSQKLPDYLKKLESYKNREYETALIDAFLGLDGIIATEEVMEELKVIAGIKKSGDAEDGNDDEDEDEENVYSLYEEATMPIEQVMEKYTQNANSDHCKGASKKLLTSYFNASSSKKDPLALDGACSSGTSASGSAVTDSKESENENSTSETEDLNRSEDKNGILEKSTTEPETSVDVISPRKDESVVKDVTEHAVKENGSLLEEKSPLEVTPVENGSASRKGKGKVLAKTKGVVLKEARNHPRRTANQIYAKILDFEDCSEEESEDENDETFEGADDGTSSEDGDKAEVENEGPDEAGDEEGEEEEEEEEEEDDENDGDEDTEFMRNMRENPGMDSGCTAVVALLQGNKLYVANAGDSRCIISRGGKALDMSIDHKPEDQIEHDRIKKAGGRVTWPEGRVNGCLNLSRAIGDHAYKQNKTLSDREQMITALPDVKCVTIKPPINDFDNKTTESDCDEFMVLACDGIWNSMSSQDVVDFVRPLITKEQSLSKICEELFQRCLATDTLGDGTGCDNMTSIIVQFKGHRKRSPSEEPKGNDNIKHLKTDESHKAEQVS